MKKLKFIGESVKGSWSHHLTPGATYETYNSVEHGGALIIRNDFFVVLKLDSERLKGFEEID